MKINDLLNINIPKPSKKLEKFKRDWQLKKEMGRDEIAQLASKIPSLSKRLSYLSRCTKDWYKVAAIYEADVLAGNMDPKQAFEYAEILFSKRPAAKRASAA